MSNFGDNNDGYIFVRGDISIIGDNGHKAAFKNCAQFTNCITKFDGTTIVDAEDLSVVIC